MMDDDHGQLIHLEKDAVVLMVRAVEPVHHNLPAPTGLDSNTSKVLVEPVGPYEQDQPYGRSPGWGKKRTRRTCTVGVETGQNARSTAVPFPPASSASSPIPSALRFGS